MFIDKNKILQVLRSRGLHHRADWVDRQLPDQVDIAHNAGLLATLNLTPEDLANAEYSANTATGATPAR